MSDGERTVETGFSKLVLTKVNVQHERDRTEVVAIFMACEVPSSRAASHYDPYDHMDERDLIEQAQLITASLVRRMSIRRTHCVTPDAD